MNELYCVLKRSHVVDAFPRWESIEYFEDYSVAERFVLDGISGLSYMDIVAIVSAEHIVDVGDNAIWLGVVAVDGMLVPAPKPKFFKMEPSEWLKFYESNDDGAMYVSDMIDLMEDNSMILESLIVCFRHSFEPMKDEEKNDDDVEIFKGIDEIIEGMRSMVLRQEVDAAYFYRKIDELCALDCAGEVATIGYAFEYIHYRTSTTPKAHSRYSMTEFFNSCSGLKDTYVHEREMAEIMRSIAPVSLVMLAALGEYHELPR